jgi:hypothetical protein
MNYRQRLFSETGRLQGKQKGRRYRGDSMSQQRTPEQQKRDKARLRDIAKRGGPRSKNEALVYRALKNRCPATADSLFPK